MGVVLLEKTFQRRSELTLDGIAGMGLLLARIFDRTQQELEKKEPKVQILLRSFLNSINLHSLQGTLKAVAQLHLWHLWFIALHQVFSEYVFQGLLKWSQRQELNSEVFLSSFGRKKKTPTTQLNLKKRILLASVDENFPFWILFYSFSHMKQWF